MNQSRKRMAQQLNYIILPKDQGGQFKYRVVLNDGTVKNSDFLNKEDIKSWLKAMHEGGLYIEYEEVAKFPIAGREYDEEEA
jgi:hypothetical protein